MSNPLGMPDWLYAIEVQYLPPQKNAVWIPTFLPQQYINEPNNQGGVSSQPIRLTYFPTLATAQTIQSKYSPSGSVIEVPYAGAGGPDAATLPTTYSVTFQSVAGGLILIDAGMLAAIWANNPTQPDAADNICTQLIAARGAKSA
jgi:hypothetical protein